MASPKSLTLYGLKTCDGCRKAKRWLNEHNLDFISYDVRDDGLNAALVRTWAGAAGWERLLNKSSRTWRSLPESAKTDLDEHRAIVLLLEHPTLLKRPVLVDGDTVLVGFTEASYETLLS